MIGGRERNARIPIDPNTLFCGNNEKVNTKEITFKLCYMDKNLRSRAWATRQDRLGLKRESA
jgi:hypothetical protein